MNVYALDLLWILLDSFSSAGKVPLIRNSLIGLAHDGISRTKNTGASTSMLSTSIISSGMGTAVPELAGTVPGFAGAVPGFPSSISIGTMCDSGTKIDSDSGLGLI